NEEIEIEKVKEIQEFTNLYQGKTITLTIERQNEVFEKSLIPRVSPPQGEGSMGVGLIRTAKISYPWYTAPIKGVEACKNLTVAIIEAFFQLFRNLAQGKGLPSGVQLIGPVGIGSLMTQAAQMGVSYYLQFIAMISIYLAVLNIMPIPAFDGGRLVFLGIEKLRGRVLNQKIEQNINAIVFVLFIVLMIWVTIRDIARLF
ncbi:site-2 protease family protein, partial [Patescibacteria group bacterium]